MNRTRNAFGVIAAIAATALFASACSSSGGDKTGSSDGPTQPTTGASTSSGAGSAYRADLFAMLPPEIQSKKTIVVANPEDTSLVFLKSDGKTLTGPVPDLATALEPILGVKFKWQETPFPNEIPGLQSGKYDLGWGSITDTKERQATLDFVDFVTSFDTLFVPAGNPKKVTGMDTLCGLKAASLSGSAQLQALKVQSTKCTQAGKKAISTSGYAGTSDVLLALRSEKVDVFFGTYTSAIHNLQAGGQSKLFTTVGPLYDAAPSGIGIKKGRGQFAQAIQGALQVLVDNGTYAKILNAYGYGKTAIQGGKITVNGATS